MAGTSVLQQHCPIINMAKGAHSSEGLAQGHTDNSEGTKTGAHAHAHSPVGLLGREGGLRVPPSP